MMLKTPLYSRFRLTARHAEDLRDNALAKRFWNKMPYGYREFGEQLRGFFHPALARMWSESKGRDERPALVLSPVSSFLGMNQGHTELERTLVFLDERSVESAPRWFSTLPSRHRMLPRA